MSIVHFILDEAAHLGPLDCVNTAIALGRSYDIRLVLAYQSIGQTEKCFPDGQHQVLLSNTTQIFFGVNDNVTAEFVSNRLGEETIVLQSGGTSRSWTKQASSGMHSGESYSTSTSSNYNWNLQARKLLKPEEVAALPARCAITFTNNVPPIATELIRYYEEKNLMQEANGKVIQDASAVRLLRAVLLAISMFVVAAMMTNALGRLL